MSSRAGNFSSSEIHRLMSKGRGNWSLENVGAPFTSYVQEKVYERRLGRALLQKQNSRSTSWGTFVEKRVFDLLSMKYKLISQDRYTHPTIKNWNGMPDTVTRDKQIVSDIKCPWSLKSFCEMVELLEKESWEALKENKPEYYWQLVSNSILTGAPKAELIVYVPFKGELEAIKEMANKHSFDGKLDENDVAFINFAADSELPHLIEGEGYNNLYSYTWEVAESEKQLLTERVKMASEILTEKTKK